MNPTYFQQTRILDGGMGQELLRRGIGNTGTLWSTNALLDEQNHPVIQQTHRDFIHAGADVIVTNSFTARKLRMQENGVEQHFVKANKVAARLARQAADASFTKVYVAGSLPPQHHTYQPTTLDEATHICYTREQAELLQPDVDFFYLDVMSSVQELRFVLRAIKPLDMPILIGLHIRDTDTLPSHESVFQAIEAIDKLVAAERVLGIIAACVSPEIATKTLPALQQSPVPYGFKVNGFEYIPHNWKLQNTGESPTKTLGSRQDLTPERLRVAAARLHEQGATILGGCCETTPSHIAALATLKRATSVAH